MDSDCRQFGARKLVRRTVVLEIYLLSKDVHPTAAEFREFGEKVIKKAHPTPAFILTITMMKAKNPLAWTHHQMLSLIHISEPTRPY